MHSSLEDAIRRGWRNDGSLPQGWECLQDENSGKQLYVDHNTQTTSWVDPRDYLRKPHTFEECVGDELPYGWEEAVDREVGVYFINHNEWTTQLDDPRIYSTSNQHKKEFSSFLKDTDARVRFLRQKARDIEARLKKAHQELGALHSQRRLARMQGEEPDVVLDQAVADKEAEIRQLEEELALVQQEMEALLRGLHDLNPLASNIEKPMPLGEVKDKIKVLQNVLEATDKKSKEREALEEALLDSGLDYSVKYNGALQRELNSLRMQQQQQLDAMRSEYERLVQAQRAMYEQQLNGNVREALYREAQLKDLVHLKHEEKHQLEIATEKMKDLIAIHELQARRLAERVEELQRENELQRHRLDHILQMRQREQDTLQGYVRQGVDLSFLNDYVSKAQLAEALSQLRTMSEQDKKEIWREMEATSDVFMPKTKLEGILNSHEAQLDELRRLLAMKPNERASARRVWNENLQTFEEVGGTRSAAPAAPPVFRPKSGLELDLDLTAARREYERLEKDVQQLKAMRGQLIAAEEESLRQAVTAALTSSNFTSRNDTPTSMDLHDRQVSGAAHISTGVGTSGTDPADPADVLASAISSAGIGTSTGTSTGGQTAASTAKRTATADADVNTDDTEVLRGRGRAQPSSRNKSIDAPRFTSPQAPHPRGPRGVTSPVNSVDSDHLLDGEDWMTNPKVLDMLQVKDDSRKRVAQLREEAQGKVMQLREKARLHPTRMSFSDKMAYFTTAGAGIHKDIQKRHTGDKGDPL